MLSRTAVTTANAPSLREAVAYFVRLLGMVREYWSGLAKALGIGLIVGAIALVPPYLSKLYFDNVYPARDVTLLHVLVLGSIAISVTSTLVGGLRTYYTQVVSTKLGSAVVLMYFNHLQHLPVQFFDEHRVGEIMSRLTDVRASLSTISRVFQTLFVNGIYLVLVPPFLIALSWRLSLVALIATPLTVVISTVASRLSRRYLKQSAEAAAELGAIQVEVLSQIRTFKAMGLEHKVFTDTSEQTSEVMHTQLKAGAVNAAVSLGTGVIRAAGTAVFTLYAWTLILRGDISLGGFVAFSAYLGYLVGPVGQVAGLFADFQQMSVALGRAFEYLDLETEQAPEVSYSHALPPAVPLRGEIRLERVSFAYSGNRPVLIDVSLTCSPGTVTAIVGTSGAGKSSVLRLLCRMGNASQGRITIDGRTIEQIPLAELRRQLAVVWQEPALFRGTIWENLTVGLEDATRAEVQDVVEACRLGDLIETLPSGYDTPIAEWGASLSGGQRQRFTIARALLRDAPILLLDEATSQVDVRTEEEVLREIVPRARAKTVIFVTHRLGTAAIADQICILDNGRVAEVGTHDELVARSATYGRMLQASNAGEDLRKLRILGVN